MGNLSSSASVVADAVTHPVTVQVINQGPGIWGNVATGLITAGAAIAAVMLTHRFTLKREKQASEKKLIQERLFIAIELVFMLEQFANDCELVTRDTGITEGIRRVPLNKSPTINFEAVSGDWRTLPLKLMYRIRQLPVLQNDAEGAIALSYGLDSSLQKFNAFSERQYRYSQLGIKSAVLAMKLRKHVGLPASSLIGKQWSTWELLRLAWRGERKKRSAAAKLRAGELAAFEVRNDMRSKAAYDAPGSGEKA
jgi:hypothetical protein